MFLVFALLCWASAASFALIPHEYHFILSYAPGNSSSMIFINDRFLGLTARANAHDGIVAHIRNALQAQEDVTIQFHGMLQGETSQMDGVRFVTQMSIPRGQTFTHTFHVYPAGTHLHHSHAGHQAITKFRALIVNDPFGPWRLVEGLSGPSMLSDHWKGIERLRRKKIEQIAISMVRRTDEYSDQWTEELRVDTRS